MIMGCIPRRGNLLMQAADRVCSVILFFASKHCLLLINNVELKSIYCTANVSFSLHHFSIDQFPEPGHVGLHPVEHGLHMPLSDALDWLVLWDALKERAKLFNSYQGICAPSMDFKQSVEVSCMLLRASLRFIFFLSPGHVGLGSVKHGLHMPLSDTLYWLVLWDALEERAKLLYTVQVFMCCWWTYYSL